MKSCNSIVKFALHVSSYVLVDDCSFMRHSPSCSPLDLVETICENAHVMGESYSFGLS
jgi:hypothetical protein